MKSKINKSNLLLLRANKILKSHYSNILNGRDLTKEEIILEAKNVIRKYDDAPFLVDMSFVFKLEKEDWEKIAKMEIWG